MEKSNKVTMERVWKHVTPRGVYKILKTISEITDEVYAQLKGVYPESDHGFNTGYYTVVFESSVSSIDSDYHTLSEAAEDEIELFLSHFQNFSSEES